MAETEPPLKETHFAFTKLNVGNQHSRHYSFIPQSIYVRLERVLRSYGNFCATHAWETICTIVTLTMCVVSCSLIRTIPREAGSNTRVEVEEVGANLGISISYCFS